ncbi:hypothetical protein JCGZ_12897 [Jatropha curcas]|uniref:Uncharacterized protein n=1 Tax=Jatropha curcas TaxID=180498 RepID=A0A067KED1_JATCU|nr:uncharacterized protein LOC105638487 [Jatropha curcas]KDP33348.1 hypothetical protein JCGZ_12897 [Jatropha curcas]
MSEPNQELEISTTSDGGNTIPDNLSEESIDFTLLRLNSFNSSDNNTNTDNPTAATHCHTPCTACGCRRSSFPPTNISSSTNKRRSPDLNATKLDPEDQIPKKPKKLFLEPQEKTVSTPSLYGFSKITLPFSIGSDNSAQAPAIDPVPLLRRCHSDPYNPPVAGSDSLSGSCMGSASKLAPQSPPENSKIVGATDVTTPASKATASLPPRPPILRRCVSDPSPNKSYSRSSSSNDMTVDGTPHYEWLKRMRDRMKEMNQWWDELMLDEARCEEEQEDKGTEENETTIAAVQGGSVREHDESVSVEKIEGCFVACFRCPCGKSYRILFSGKDCYYKLI